MALWTRTGWREPRSVTLLDGPRRLHMNTVSGYKALTWHRRRGGVEEEEKEEREWKQCALRNLIRYIHKNTAYNNTVRRTRPALRLNSNFEEGCLRESFATDGHRLALYPGICPYNNVKH